MLIPSHSVQPPRYGEPEFRADAKTRLPELAEAIESHAGLLHVVFVELTVAGRAAIDAGDLAFLRRLFAFVAEAVERPGVDPEIENAVAISFLEPDDFNGPGGVAAAMLLPDRVRALIHEAV